MNYVKETICRMILMVDNRPTILEKLHYLVGLIVTFGPIAYILDGLNLWFENNQQFSSFVIICLLVNLLVGVRYHNKMGTFNWKEFFVKNIEMWVILILVYGLLEMLRITAGNNFVGEGFKVLIQVMTLLYPISKALKNIYILSNKKFPPSFIMDKIYTFEKNGDLNDLFHIDKKQDDK